MRAIGLFLLTGLGLGGCDSPPPQPQDSNVINATRTDQAFPSGAGGNDITTGSGATTAPAGGQQGEQQGPPPQ
ncbi:MAG: hypothetical protein H0U34_00925 [Sphingomonas sp.]|nr:hypothetical protein [Sphingomonas sp.]